MTIPIKGPDEPLTERRTATPIGNTDSVPEGTMITVPTAPPTGGSGTAPVVAVNTVDKWVDPQFWISVITALTGLVSSIQEIIPSDGGIDWRVFPFKLLLLILGAVSAFLRQRTNTVTK